MSGPDGVHLRTCPLCEAMCGLERHVDGRPRRRRSAPNDDDVWSHGYICPKGTTLGELHDDPDRLRAPLVRDGDALARGRPGTRRSPRSSGGCAPVLERARPRRRHRLHRQSHRAQLLAVALRAGVRRDGGAAAHLLRRHRRPVAEERGRRADVRRHVDDPDARPRPHRLPARCSARIRTRRRAACSPRPTCSAGFDAIRARGGKVVVVDPRRTGTAATTPTSGSRSARAPTRAAAGDGAGAVRRGPRAPAARSPAACNGVDEVRALAARFTPEAVADDVRDPRRDDPPPGARARRRAARRGVRPHRHLQPGVRHARLLAGRGAERPHRQPRPRGRLDVREPDRVVADLADAARVRRRLRASAAGRAACAARPRCSARCPSRAWPRRSRRRARASSSALITIAGNPVLSSPDAGRLDAALPQLECMVSVDNWLNETTRHAHVILPGLSALEQPHYDELIWSLGGAQRGQVLGAGLRRPSRSGRHEWEILLTLAALAAGRAGRRRRRARARRPLLRPGSSPAAAAAGLADRGARSGGDRRRDARARAGAPARLRDPHRALGRRATAPNPGRAHARRASSAQPNGIDLRRARRRASTTCCATPSGKVELAPPHITADLAAAARSASRAATTASCWSAAATCARTTPGCTTSPSLVTGKDRCTLLVHPDDARALGLATARRARVDVERRQPRRRRSR